MFSWITGPRLANAIEDLQPENNYESTIIEAPETPAPQFAVKAFKHALFGTPAPEDVSKASTKFERKAKLDIANTKGIELHAPVEDGLLLSPSKQPGGILMTPGTANRGRKTVSFGSQVVDNEGKRGNIGKSGIPNNCPGKFPSPWTPGTELIADVASDKRPRTRLTEVLLDARTTTQPKPGQKPKARDDSDITIDLGAPRSESGKYWKEQYESYAEKSEKEMRKVIAKQQLAKKFAMKKDGEVTELATKLELERKKFRQRERELEQQNKDFEEKMRQAIADKASATIEMTVLKERIAALERSAAMTSSDIMQNKPSFEIYEDISREAIQVFPEVERNHDLSFAPSLSMASSGKENKSPKPQRHRRQTLPESIHRSDAQSRLGTEEGEASIILGRSPRPLTRAVDMPSNTAPVPGLLEQTSRSPLRTRRTEPTKENFSLQPTEAVPPSSPLPVPSPGMDPWMDMDITNPSSIQRLDKMAIPGYSGEPFSRPEWNPPPRQQRTLKSVSHTKTTSSSKPLDRKVDEMKVSDSRSQPIERAMRNVEAQSNLATNKEGQNKLGFRNTEPKISEKMAAVPVVSPTDAGFDLSKITAQRVQGSSQARKARVEIDPEERKAMARKRLEEKKRLRRQAQGK
ncbi:spindle pole body formation-associated protein-domain-containing protein [Phaeosphaeriaceae sp. PMI808]|nr:spindle pole body formation-associated protein-domain-containing protein [Phaeosphaeriaceae sp. PMI808]